jgi:manganese efflux pump family protein
VLALLLVSVSLGMDNFAAAIAIGLSGVDRRLRLRIALSFGLFEAGMPILGLLIGRHAASTLGSYADLIAGFLVIATGLYSLFSALRGDLQPITAASPPTGRLIITGFALSFDNLVVGFALGAYNVSLVVAAVVIGVVSIAMSLAGLELGARLGEHVLRGSDLLAGVILIVVGIAIAVGVA